MQNETYQIANKRKSLMKNNKKKVLLVIAEICCPQEIKNTNALAYAISISFVSM